MKQIENRYCLFCDIEFTPKRTSQLYCNSKHRNRLWKPIQINCKFCTKEFWKDRTNQDFCSKNCSRLYHLKEYERPKIPKSVFIGTREEVVNNLIHWLEENEYLGE